MSINKNFVVSEEEVYPKTLCEKFKRRPEHLYKNLTPQCKRLVDMVFCKITIYNLQL